jgi:membrane peptidoglycan carboxypeptidase
VWMGNDDGTPMDGVSGGGLPARVWRDFMLASVPGQGPPLPVYSDARHEPPRRAGFWRRLFGGGERGKGKGKKKKWR